MSQAATSFHTFSTPPGELRSMIWEISAAFSRFLELVIKPNYTTSSAPVEQGFVYFLTATDFNSKLPGGLMDIKKVRRAILSQYSHLELGTHHVQRPEDVEFLWELHLDADPDNMALTQVLFNPECDILVLHVGLVLFKQGVLQAKISRQLRRTRSTRAGQMSLHIQNLATIYFPWDTDNETPDSCDDMVEAFLDFRIYTSLGNGTRTTSVIVATVHLLH